MVIVKSALIFYRMFYFSNVDYTTFILLHLFLFFLILQKKTLMRTTTY